eukprot:CAMPEP_0176364472 /NCGR_PEP_ID=MMETSP0126-20121128/19812_1 /TAXON_ID=141414 ORGANISM="Strombidinopsis acuminatum, Strain SPMC142" /NCGR_SAMPLE_ID=MMETSP0126 /ASSEMBLY_ACC=CAM_ASM_000229 /LENGTH=50 /DNA_ID=CAMNT_0017721123 /DNA_START=600 /DNA_END=752 /DNA_ORIENTATION=+
MKGDETDRIVSSVISPRAMFDPSEASVLNNDSVLDNPTDMEPDNKNSQVD